MTSSPPKYRYVAHVAGAVFTTAGQICRRCLQAVIAPKNERSFHFREGDFVVERMQWFSDYNGVGYRTTGCFRTSPEEIIENKRIEFCLSPIEVSREIEYLCSRTAKASNLTVGPKNTSPVDPAKPD